MHCIEAPDVEWINERISRRALIWWNYPVSDFVRDHILLGKVYGNGLDFAPLASGFVSNPMEHPEASKIALYQVADYAWNMQAYDSLASWKRSIEYIMPENADELFAFADVSSDLGANGHGFRRAESTSLLPTAQRLREHPDDNAALDTLDAACLRLLMATNTLLATNEAPEFMNEIRPWVEQGRNTDWPLCKWHAAKTFPGLTAPQGLCDSKCTGSAKRPIRIPISRE